MRLTRIKNNQTDKGIEKNEIIYEKAKEECRVKEAQSYYQRFSACWRPQ
jgi:hypothetical protein